MPEKIRIGFVGVGGMGQCAHLVNYASLPDCHVAALSELRPELAKRVAARYAIPAVYSNFHDMLAHESLDALVHINQFQFHGQTLPDLAQFNKPILTEKPLANSVEAGEAILAALQKTKTSHYLAYHKRSDPAVVYAKNLMAQWLASNEFGELRYIRLAMPPGDWQAAGFTNLITTPEKNPPSTQDPRPDSFTTEQFNHYVYLVNYYIHQINLLRHLLGDYSVTYADPNGRLLVARGENGITAAIEMASHETGVDWQESVFIAFRRAWIRIDLPAPLAVNRPGKVTVHRDTKGQTPETLTPDLPWIHAMRQQASNFLAAVRGEKTPLATSEDGLKDLRSMREYLAIYSQNGGPLRPN